MKISTVALGSRAAVTLAAALCVPLPLAAQDPDSVVAVDSTAVLDSTAIDSTQVAFRPLPPEAVRHLGHLTVAYADTPEGRGLIDTGMAEAEIALEYARLAGSDSTNLSAMTRNMVHVIHAVDPAQAAGGYGLGYGVRRAAEGVLAHMDLATGVEGVSEDLVFHAAYVTAAARSTLRQVDEVVDLARRIQRSDDPVAANRMVRSLARAIRAMAYGSDADRDGRIGHTEAEMGLAQSAHHLTLVRRVARLER